MQYTSVLLNKSKPNLTKFLSVSFIKRQKLWKHTAKMIIFYLLSPLNYV